MTDPACGTPLLQRVEEDLSIFALEIEGFALWPVVRFRAYQIISGIQTGVTQGSLWQRLRYRPRDVTMPLYAAWSLLQRRRLRKRSFDFLFLSNEAYRSVKRADGWWDVYLDDIAAHPVLAGRVLRCEARRFAISPFHTPGPRHLFLDAQTLQQAMANRRQPDDEAAAQGRRLNELFCRKLSDLGAPLSAEQRGILIDVCIRQANAFLHALRWFDRLFAEVSPRVLVVMTAYGRHAAVAAALRRGIEVIEFQHGLIHWDHPGYIWPSCARRVRDRLPLPTRIATYGDYWSELLTTGGFWKADEIVSVGSVRMDWLRWRAAPRRGEAGAPRIIFTTQYATRDSAIRLLAEFLDLANAASLRFNLLIKVHRSEAAFIGQYQKLAGRSPNVTVRSAYQGDTLLLIAESDVHVSGWSTCHYEAVGLGTPTIVLRFPGPDRVADLEGLPGVSFAASAQRLLELVAQIPAAQATSSAGHDAADKLFKRDAVENAVALLSEYAASGTS